MPFRGLFATVAKAISSLIFSDSFNRTTTGSLGTSSSGGTWTALRGVWYANGTQAQSDDAATNYSIASTNMGSANVKTSATVSSGTGVAFWVSSANSWWASTSYETSSTYSYTCNCTTCCNSCANSACGCATYNSQTNCSVCGSTTTYVSCTCSYSCGYNGGSSYNTVDSCGYVFTCNGTSTYSGSYSNICPQTTCNTCTNSAFGCATYNTCANCSACGSYSCCSTCTGTSYSYYLRMLQSVGGTVSTATGDVSLASGAVSIQVATLGNTITATAYDASGATLGTQTYTPTSPTTGTSTGIIKAPSSYNQGSTVDNFLSSSH